MADDAWATQQEDFALDGSGYNSADLGGGGETVDKEGWYHWEVADVVAELDTLKDDGKEKSPCIRFDLLVLETVKGQSPAGSRHFHRVYVAGKGGAAPAEGSVKGALRFGLGLGLLASIEKDGREVIVDKTTGSTRIPSAIWQRAKGMQFVSKVRLQKDEKYGDKFEIPFGRVYQVDDPAVADVPKNKEALSMLGKGGSAGPGAAKSPPANGSQQQTKPAQQPAGAAAAAPADDDLSDL